MGLWEQDDRHDAEGTLKEEAKVRGRAAASSKRSADEAPENHGPNSKNAGDPCTSHYECKNGGRCDVSGLEAGSKFCSDTEA